MKRFIPALLFLGILNGANAQMAPDVTETDCDNVTESVAEAILPGVPLIVIASGYDCGICHSEAPGFDTMADTLVGKARVWGAMHHRFSSTTPTCNQLDGWLSNYGWDNFFVFNDINNGTAKSWAQGGYTSYTVIDVDQTYLYRGTNRTTALNELFDAIEANVTGIPYAEPSKETMTFAVDGNELKVTAANGQSGTLSVTTTDGTLVHFEELTLAQGENVITMEGATSGMLIATFVMENKTRVSQKLINTL